MKLAFLLFSWFPHGGMQQDVVKIARACSKRADVSIFCLECQGDVPDDVDIQLVPVKGLTRTGRRADFVRQMQSLLPSRFDRIVGFNRMPGLHWYFAADLCFAFKAMYQRNLLYRLAPRSRQYLAWEQAVFGQDSSTCIMLLSPQQREQYKACYHTQDVRLFDLPPGISRHFVPSGNEARLRESKRRELGLGDDDLLVLQVGSGLRTKGVLRSLQALAVLPEDLGKRVHYCLLGKDPQKAVLRLADKLDRTHIHLPGTRDDVSDYMHAADLLLHPSVQESAGMVLLEAIVCGLPVLTTAACGYAFHVEQANAGVVCREPFAQQDLNRALEQMLRADRSYWQQAGLAYGRNTRLFDMPEEAARLLCENGDDNG